VPPEDRDGDLLAAYARLMEHPDPKVRLRAARDWCAWEDSVVSQEGYGAANPYGRRAEDALVAFVRICAHYFSHYMWLEDDALFRNVDRLAGIPGTLLHGRLDLSGPAVNAWELSRVWPDARLRIFGGSGHRGNDAMVEELIRALDAFARI
jgi:proline iminopeptidase